MATAVLEGDGNLPPTNAELPPSNPTLPPALPRPELGQTSHNVHTLQPKGIVDSIISKLHNCTEGIQQVMEMEMNLFDSNALSLQNLSLLELEQTMLHLGSKEGLCTGVLYVLPVEVENNQYLLRHYESGQYVGFMQKYGLHMLADILKTDESNLHLWNVYCGMDNMLNTILDRKTKNSTLYNRLMTINVGSIKQILARAAESKIFDEEFLLLHVNKGSRQEGNKDERFTHLSKKLEHTQNLWEELLSKNVIVGEAPTCSQTVIEQILDMATCTLADQLALLSSISNYHWWQWKAQGNQKRKKLQVSFAQHLIHHPGVRYDERGILRSSHMPTSARNQVMFYIHNDPEYSTKLRTLISHLCQYDRKEVCLVPEPNDEEFGESAPKQRRYKTRLLTVTAQTLCEHIGETIANVQNFADSNRSMYKVFSEELVSEGTILLRKHSDDEIIVVLSDYSSSSGMLLPLSYVHLTCTTCDDGTMLLRCSCEIYQQIESAGLKNVQLAEFENAVVNDQSSKMTCMHCRFYREFLGNGMQQILNRKGTTHVLRKVQESIDSIKSPILLLGVASPSCTTKLSVLGDDEGYSLVHISFDEGGCFAKCMNGLCHARLLNKKRMPKTLTAQKARNSCQHMKKLYDNMSFLEELFPDYFCEEDNDIMIPPLAGESNTADYCLKELQQTITFNKDTGLWETSALSTHKPKSMMDAGLVSNTSHRLTFVRDENFHQDSGTYIGPNLVPLPFNKDGTPKPMCECGSGWTDDQNPNGTTPFLVNRIKLFTRNAVLTSTVFARRCISGRCILQYSGEDNDIFLLSSITACGEEMGWDFMALVKCSKISFTAYCKDMSRRYITNKIGSAPFLSVKTFGKWLFSWIVCMQIDFRQEIDPVCRHNPQVLAADGTHIGVSRKQLKLEQPITASELPEEILPKHKRFQRVLLQYPAKQPGETIKEHKERCKMVKRARTYLMYICRKVLGKEQRCKKALTAPEEEIEKEHLLWVLDRLGRDGMRKFLQKFVRKQVVPDMLVLSAKLLLLMTGDGPISAALPTRFHQHLLDTCQVLTDGADGKELLEYMKSYAFEVAEMLKYCRDIVDEEYMELCVSFLQSLIESIKNTHRNDRPTPATQEMAGTYNPPSGVAYYFTASGNQLRKTPHYKISGQGPVHDDKPEIDGVCNKMFPKVSVGGFGYMLFVFCPIHGHCYGFHLIETGEGRKDPFSAVYKYKEEPPKEFYYDFACQLSEYCLNREPEFWKGTRFWHDLWHGISHLCGDVFKSTRVLGTVGINSEICEQFNAYMQCVKYTGSHLAQHHFMLFSQFMVYLWNQGKTEKFKKIACVASAGAQ